MSSSNAQTLTLYKVNKKDGSFVEFGTASVKNHDVFFPEGVDGWSDVLDCRTEPYKDKTVEENCHFASHVHKKFIVMAPKP